MLGFLCRRLRLLDDIEEASNGLSPGVLTYLVRPDYKGVPLVLFQDHHPLHRWVAVGTHFKPIRTPGPLVEGVIEFGVLGIHIDFPVESLLQ